MRVVKHRECCDDAAISKRSDGRYQCPIIDLLNPDNAILYGLCSRIFCLKHAERLGQTYSCQLIAHTSRIASGGTKLPTTVKAARELESRILTCCERVTRAPTLFDLRLNASLQS